VCVVLCDREGGGGGGGGAKGKSEPMLTQISVSFRAPFGGRLTKGVTLQGSFWQ